MKNYLNLLEFVLSTGKKKKDRTGVGTLSCFGYQSRYDLNHFPLVTTKKIFFKAVVVELLWFLKGSSHIKYLKEHNVRIWDEWVKDDDTLGPIYGVQWRSWKGSNSKTYDQIAWLMKELQHNPYSRRLIVSAWNVAELEDMALAPCHTLFQFYVQDNTLSCQLYQRSADAFLGVPFNIASYALLTHLIAKTLNFKVGEFIHTIGDLHLYLNHIDQAKLQLTREPYPAPNIIINKKDTIDEYSLEDISLENYNHHPHIKGVVAV